MDRRITLGVLIILLIYSLYYTYNYDFGMFLYLILLIVAGLFIYEYVEYRINYYSEKIDTSLLDIKTKIDDSLSNLDFVKNIITSLFVQRK